MKGGGGGGAQIWGVNDHEALWNIPVYIPSLGDTDRRAGMGFCRLSPAPVVGCGAGVCATESRWFLGYREGGRLPPYAGITLCAVPEGGAGRAGGWDGFSASALSLSVPPCH